MLRDLANLALLAILAGACGGPRRSVATTPTPFSGPSAVIGDTIATFVFSPETTATFVRQTDGSCDGGSAAFAWMVYWWPRDIARIGEIPTSLLLRIPCTSEAVLQSRLSELVASVRPAVMTYVNGSEPPASRGGPDEAFIATVEGNSVVFQIRGRAAIDRILSAVPDSVTLIRMVRPAWTENRTTIPVRRH